MVLRLQSPSIISEEDELLSVIITADNVSDINPTLIKNLTKTLHGKLIADKGYLAAKVFDALFQRVPHLIIKVKKNMINRPMPLLDKLLLRKRAIIEHVFNVLKNTCQIERTRHRSLRDGFLNLISALVAYTFMPNKPKVKFDGFQAYNPDLQQLILCSYPEFRSMLRSVHGQRISKPDTIMQVWSTQLPASIILYRLHPLQMFRYCGLTL